MRKYTFPKLWKQLSIMIFFLCHPRFLLSSDLKPGTRFVTFHNFGKQLTTTKWFVLKKVHEGEEIQFTHSFNRRGDIMSGPQDLPTFTCSRVSFTSAGEIEMLLRPSPSKSLKRQSSCDGLPLSILNTELK